MDFGEVQKKIKTIFGEDSFKKARNYSRYYIRNQKKIRYGDGWEIKHTFKVESETSYNYYDVTIHTNRGEIEKYSCDCPQYKRVGTCKHIAACCLNYYEDIFERPADPYEVTKNFLDSFTSKSKENGIKEKIKLEIELDLSGTNISYKLNVGLNRTYVINNDIKFQNFMSAYKNGGKYTLGTQFTFDSSKHYFDEIDQWFLNFFYGYKKNSYYSYYDRNNIFELSDREASILFDKLKDKRFNIKGYGYSLGIKNEVPTGLKLELENENYILKIDDINNYTFLDTNYKYILYNKILYIIPEVYSKIFETLRENHINQLLFKKDKVEVFKNGLLKQVKDNITIGEEIEDILISGKPNISLYFDFKVNKITCKIKLKYKNIEIDYFDINTNIVRDEEEENKGINDLLNLKFVINDKKIELDKIEDIGYFLEEGILLLQEKYNIYTSKKIDSMDIIKKSNIQSNFSIGKDGIMSYDFQVDNIELEELSSIISSLKTQKKYYKLKNGNIINLEENEELKEFTNLLDDLEINSKNIQDGNIEIPKYRAFYIDSLKNEKYKSIHTSSTFENFINNFKKYQNSEIKFSKEDEKILRNYQKDGVKWLYTLYKCDLGGILADEMGLGKSIQTISFIKQIIKEKKDAKIMIVCPTALVYNWISEFDKFGSDLKYVAVAENKEKRLQIIKDFNKYNIFITSYGLIRNDNDEYEDKEFDLCVIDEAQAIKNYQANMTKEIKKIKAKTKIALTGTPLENSVLELWSIFDFILPGYLNSLMKFKEKYGIKDVDEESLSKLTLLNYQIKPFILRRKKIEVTKDLPEKIENNIYLELPKMQKALYLEELNRTKKEMDELIATHGFSKARFKILQLLMKLRQICVDPGVLYKDYKYDSIKIEKLTEIVKDFVADNHKILIFSSFKRVIDRVKKNFDKEGISNYTISGEVNSKTRKELVDKFNKDDTNCFLITLKSGGVGLNLTSADIVIHLDIWWNPQVENQATDRAHRIGQTNKVTVIRLITKGTIEERILELQNKKRILSDNLIEGKDDNTLINTISEEEMQNLLSFGDDENDF